MGKLMFFQNLGAGHVTLGLTTMKYMYAKFGNAHEFLVVCDVRYKEKSLRECPFARVRLFKNPVLGESFDPKKDLDPHHKNMDEAGKSFVKPLEERIKRKPAVLTRMSSELKVIQPEIESIIEDEKPDFILFDNLFTIPYFINKSIPWGFACSLSPIYLQYGEEEEIPPLGSGLSSDPTNQDKWNSFRSMYKEIMKPFYDYLNDWLIKCHQEPVAHCNVIFGSPYLNIYLYPKEIDYYENKPKPKGNWVRVDSCILPDHIRNKIGEKISELELDLNSFPQNDSDRRLVYLSLGTLVSTQVQVLQRLLDMFATIPHNFVISKGIRGDQLIMPKNCIGANYLNQLKLLPKVHLMITHGGNNSFTECFHFGVPVLVLPMFGDQPDNGTRVEDLGLGKSLNLISCTRDELAEAIDYLLFDQTVRQKMKNIGDRIQQDNGWEEVSEQLSIFLDKTKN